VKQAVEIYVAVVLKNLNYGFSLQKALTGPGFITNNSNKSDLLAAANKLDLLANKADLLVTNKSFKK
jgi:hypothetical protein